MMKAVKFEKNSVLINEGEIFSWVDVWIENKDVITDWNEFIFLKSVENDARLLKWQNNLENFEEATSLAIKTLEEENIIYQDKNGKWHKK